MNKRQRKKQFKKTYGYNPTKQTDIERAAKAVNKAFVEMCSAISKLIKLVEQGVAHIKEMPEEEFLERLNNSNLSSDQIAAAKLIRYGRRNKDGDQDD